MRSWLFFTLVVSIHHCCCCSGHRSGSRRSVNSKSVGSGIKDDITSRRTLLSFKPLDALILEADTASRQRQEQEQLQQQQQRRRRPRRRREGGGGGLEQQEQHHAALQKTARHHVQAVHAGNSRHVDYVSISSSSSSKSNLWPPWPFNTLSRNKRNRKGRRRYLDNNNNGEDEDLESGSGSGHSSSAAAVLKLGWRRSRIAARSVQQGMCRLFSRCRFVHCPSDRSVSTFICKGPVINRSDQMSFPVDF